MKVLLLGSGGREHALFWKLSRSPLLGSLQVFPGNGGFPLDAIAAIRSDNGQPATLSDLSVIVEFIRREKYDLVVVGPEQPLVDGVADLLEGVCPVFGPLQGGARLEGSKEFSKSFMKKYGIPTADAESFQDAQDAIAYLTTKELPVVIKADGLAAGKGVTVAYSREVAQTAIREALQEGRFGDSGHTILIEDFLQGEEASVFAICDGERALPFIAAQDFKRAFDGDRGPNTGGMGAYAPVPMMTPEIMEAVQRDVLDPVLEGMRKEGTPYRGLLYAGLMVHNGQIRVVEFNCRFGDPETQALLRLLDEDLLDLMHRAATGRLEKRKLRFLRASAIIVVLAAEGYPDDYNKNLPLENLDANVPDTIVFHAGTKRDGDRILSTGGRILGITAIGSSMEEARRKAYERIATIKAPGTFYRKDIALKAAQ